MDSTSKPMELVAFDSSAFGFETPELELPLNDPAATRRLGRLLAECLEPGDFVGLVGQLGAGKTTLVQGMVDRLDPELGATSPTYTLLNEYETTPPVVHIDLYRLETYDELESIGYWDYIESGVALSCVEWVDQIPEAWPGGRRAMIVELRHDEGSRLARLFWPADAPRSDLLEALDSAFSL